MTTNAWTIDTAAQQPRWRKFETLDKARAWGRKALARAVAAGEPTDDRFYLETPGEISTIGAHTYED